MGSEEEMKFAMIGDYWDEYIVSKVIELIHEYQELFPTNVLEMKGILGNMGFTRIPLKPEVKLVKKIPKILKPKYKEKVKEELD